MPTEAMVDRYDFDLSNEIFEGAGRNDMPAILCMKWWGNEITTSQLRHGVLEAWTLAERLVSIGERNWLAMFNAAGFVSDINASPPAVPLTVYRGAWSRSGRGMSWTKDIEKARWFANRESWLFKSRSGGSAAVWVATVPTHAVLATINAEDSRHENEVVVNPNCLRGRATPQLLEHIEYEEDESDAG